MCHEGGARIALIADYKKPSGILAKNAVWHPVEKFINFLEKVQKQPILKSFYLTKTNIKLSL